MASRIKRTSRLYNDRRPEIDAIRRAEKARLQRRKLKRQEYKQGVETRLEGMSKTHLKRLAKELEIVGRDRMSKDQLIGAIRKGR